MDQVPLAPGGDLGRYCAGSWTHAGDALRGYPPCAPAGHERKGTADASIVLKRGAQPHMGKDARRMEYTRVADIPIRHRSADYVCTIGYSENNRRFYFVSARYADPSMGEPKDSYVLYDRILNEPALRIALVEALLPHDGQEIEHIRERAFEKRAQEYSVFAGFLVFLLLVYVVYRLDYAIDEFLGAFSPIAYVAAAFGFCVIYPVQGVFRRWYTRRYCTQQGHRLTHFKDDAGTEITWCDRCGLLLRADSHELAGTNGKR